MKYFLTCTILLSCIISKAIKPIKEYVYTPDKFKLSYVDTTIASGQAELSTWLIEKDSAKGTFILAYGDAGNKSYLLQQAYFFNARGYNVILFDYRGFGGSSAFSYDSTNLYHTEYYEDLKSVYAFAKSYYVDHPIYIYAVSMRTIFASRLELRDLDGLVLDKPLLGLEHAIENLKKKGKHLNYQN
jgi:alpha-beta hydrolase superfamily lysophospholipase